MTLAQMQARFFELKGKLAVGQIAETEFKQELEKLRFQDLTGRWWMIGAQSGRWYYYDGARWLLGEPPDAVQIAPAEPITVYTPARSEPAPQPTPATSPASSAAPPLYAPASTEPLHKEGGNGSQPITAPYRYSPIAEPSAPVRTDGVAPPAGSEYGGAPVTGALAPSTALTAPSSSNSAGSTAAPAHPHSSSLGNTLRQDLAQIHLPHVQAPHVRAPNLHLPPQVISHGTGGARGVQPGVLLIGAVAIGLVLVALVFMAADNLLPSKPISTFFRTTFGGATANRPAARATAVPAPVGQNVDNLLRVGDELVARSQFDPAIAQFQAAAKYDPSEADVYTHWARALSLTGRVGEAIQTAQKATKLDPTSSRAFAELARALAWAGQTNQAINNGEKAIELDAQNANAHAFLSEAYLRAGRNNDAQKEADTALELDDANPETHRAAGWVAIISNRKDEGIGEWKRVVELAPELFLYHYELGQVYANHLGDANSAIPAYQRAIQLYPTYIPSYTALGQAYLLANQPAPAILQFQKALTLDPSSTEAFVGLGDSFRISNKCQQAIPYYQKALELNKSLDGANQGLSNCSAVAKGQAPAAAVQPTPGLANLPTAVVQATVAPLLVSTPVPKSQPNNNKPGSGGAGDGSGRIVFPVYAGGHYQLYSAKPDGSDRRVLVSDASSPLFNADGSALLYYSWVNDQRGVHRADADGENDRHVSLYAEDTLPSWSPDGARYVYATRAGIGGDINKRSYSIRVSSTGAKPRQGPPPLIEQAQYPAWGPTGKIAFRDCGFPDQTCGIATVNPDGSGKRKIIPDTINATAPAWSPDGSKIVFMSNLVGNWDLYIVDATGGSPIRITDDLAQDGLPTFSPDGNTIIYVTNRGGSWAINAMNADGENERKLFDLGGDLAGPVAGNQPAQPGQTWLEQRLTWR